MNRRGAKIAVGMLMVGVCFATIILSYRIGRQQGYAAGVKPWLKEELVVKAIDVGDLLYAGIQPRPMGANGDPMLDELPDLLKQIEVESWDDVGGEGTITEVPPDKLEIKQAPSIHKQIAKVLQAVRAGRREMADNSTNSLREAGHEPR